MTSVAEILNEGEYADLLSRTLPHVIHTELENERCTAVLEVLLSKTTKTVEEQRLAELLTLLIEDFEDKHYTIPRASPLDIVRHLMDANGLRQIDMLDVFGTPSVASEVLRGKRELAKSHIQKLSERFRLSPEVFFDVAPGNKAGR
jgi:HTH-type transcriptional regulator/antitoxin HigA